MDKVKMSLFRKLLRSQATQKVARALERLRPADVAQLFGVLEPGETITMLDVLLRRILGNRPFAQASSHQLGEYVLGSVI